MFDPQGVSREQETDPRSAVLTRIRGLQHACRHVIAVTIGGLLPEPSFDQQTIDYLTALNRVNDRIAAMADEVYDTRLPQQETR
jgi:hypothetical protein